MTDSLAQISRLLHEAAELHHHTYRITDGVDDDWAIWYADWLVRLSELPALLPAKPSRSDLTCLLVALDREHLATHPTQPWEDFYAQRILTHFTPPPA